METQRAGVSFCTTNSSPAVARAENIVELQPISMEGEKMSMTSTPIDQHGHPNITWNGTHSLDEREGLIREAAYYLYEQRGFGHGCHVDDWLAAEAALDHGNRELRPAGIADFEMQQSGVHSAWEDDELKHITKQHQQHGIPKLESDESQEESLRG